MPTRLTLICNQSTAAGALPEATPSGRSPARNMLLARGESRQVPPRAMDATLFDIFGLDAGDGKDLPIAAVTRTLLPGMVRDRWWIHADPVYCQADRDSVVLVADVSEGLSPEERQALTTALSPLFADAGMELQPGIDGWFVAAPADIRITTSLLADTLGRPILDYLPRGPDGGFWRRLMNEAQMTLHDIPINQRRISTGKPPANSLWFWGGGQLPSLPTTRPPITTWSDYPLARGLAQLAGTPCQPSPSDAQDWLGRRQSGDHLVTVRPAVPDGGSDRSSLEETWFAPLYQALKSRRLDSVTVHPLTGIVYTVTARQAGRWWKFWKASI